MRRLLGLPAVLAALALALAGCGGALGELCRVDQDCRSGLRCSTADGTRGVCLYAAAPVVDLGARDHARADRSVPDRGAPDGGAPDGGAPDRGVSEAAPTDRGLAEVLDRGPADGAP